MIVVGTAARPETATDGGPVAPAPRTSPSDGTTIARQRSIAIDLAYVEYCRLQEEGCGVLPSVFSARYPGIARSLRSVLLLHEFCWKTPDVRELLFGTPWPEAGADQAGFRLVEEIGRGAASRVFLAQDLELAGRTVVVKVGRGGREAAAVGALDHPGIVPVHSAKTDPASGLSFLCMPFLGRATLDAVIDRIYATGATPRTARDFWAAVESESGVPCTAVMQRESRTFGDAAAKVGAVLAGALAHAHANGITHADVKPSNILVSPSGTPMLLDFNLAVGHDPISGPIGGTLPYMAPEHLASWRDGAVVGPAADVFSLGVTLYELLTGKLPFGRAEGADLLTAAEALAAQHSLGAPPIWRSGAQRNRRLAGFVASCLAIDAAARPSAAELEQALLAMRSGNRRTGRTVVLFTVVAIAGFGIFYSPLRPSGRVRQPSVAIDLAQSTVVITDAPDPAASAAKGWKLLNARDLAAACNELRSAHESGGGPKVAAAYGYCLLLREGNVTEAMPLLEQALVQGGDSASARNNFGYCCLQSGDFTTAEQHLRYAYKLDPGLGVILRNLMMLELRRAAQARRSPDLTPTRAALGGCERTPYLFLDAACSYALACEHGLDYESDVARCCSEALASGLSPAELREVLTYFPAAGQREWWPPASQGPRPLSVIARRRGHIAAPFSPGEQFADASSHSAFHGGVE